MRSDHDGVGNLLIVLSCSREKELVSRHIKIATRELMGYG
jgi:hypothetical protein